jgi:hypothetical protein
MVASTHIYSAGLSSCPPTDSPPAPGECGDPGRNRARSPVLIIDEIGYLPMAGAGELVFPTHLQLREGIDDSDQRSEVRIPLSLVSQSGPLGQTFHLAAGMRNGGRGHSHCRNAVICRSLDALK